MRTYQAGILSAFLLLGCTWEPASQPYDVGTRTAAIEGRNALSWNALSWNALSWNALSWNALSWNALSWNALSWNRLEYRGLDSGALEDTEEGRMLLTYLARCALGEQDTLVVGDADDHEDGDAAAFTVQGSLGLAREWAIRPLTGREQRLISACLAAHVNAYGESVEVSLRAKEDLPANQREIRDFPVYEGTFFGDLFGPEPRVYGCQGDDARLAVMQAPDRLLRSCTDSSPDCAIQSVGRCRDVCEQHHPKYGWSACWAAGVRHDEPISVYLAADDTEDTRVCRRGRRCGQECRSASCTAHLDCQGARDCRLRCKGGAACSTDCAESRRCTYDVQDDSVAAIDCYQARQCKGRCEDDSWCEIDCFGADQCAEIRCENNAECLLNCTGANECGFKTCDGVEQSCPGDIIVCNRACPAG